MVELSRYNVSDDQAGLDQGVLKNKLGYTTQKDLDDAETILQTDAYKHFFDLAQTRQFIFGTDLLFEIHRLFLDVLVHILGFQPINYGDRKKYLAACITGASQNNKLMQKIIASGLIKRES